MVGSTYPSQPLDVHGEDEDWWYDGEQAIAGNILFKYYDILKQC